MQLISGFPCGVLRVVVSGPTPRVIYGSSHFEMNNIQPMRAVLVTLRMVFEAGGNRYKALASLRKGFGSNPRA